jgi:4-amino-4-deoxy-L-arabinose transferase-like glycosyltransferase
MFAIALFICIYSYVIFLTGVYGVLTKGNVVILTLICLFLFFFVQKKTVTLFLQKFTKKRINFTKLRSNYSVETLLPLGLLFLLVILAVVNLVGTLGPELAFDSLWYHLTLPQLYLLHQMIYHIPGGLLYYSDMPKLGEMLYIGALSFGNEITAKLIHFTFGLLVVIALYTFSKKYFNQTVSLLIVLIFYSNLVVATESITAFIDLTRTFFEFLALWGLISWSEKGDLKWLGLSALMVGAAITTKVLAVGSLIIFTPLIISIIFDPKMSANVKMFHIHVKNKVGYVITVLLGYWIIALLVPLPWLIFSYLNTGNPFYPFFSQIYEIVPNRPNLLEFFADIWNLFMYSPDPISPIYLIFLPLLLVTYSKFNKQMKLILMYCGMSLIVWYFTPRTGGGRFILAYLPAFSIICGAIYVECSNLTKTIWANLSKLLLVIIIFVSLITIGYRSIANAKFVPVVFGVETKQQFLTNELNFGFGDFYDTDGYFSLKVKQTDKVLLFGFHNLYYVDFPYIDSTWVRKGDRFDYIAIQNGKLPNRFKDWQLVYSNDKTMVQLYKPPPWGCLKTCYY